MTRLTHLPLRRALLCGLGALAAAVALPAAAADGYPNRPVKLVVGYTPGGASDVIGRLIAAELQKLNGQPVTVENKPGVGGMLAMGGVARSPADGYTLAIAVSGTMVTGPHLQPNMAYDPLSDFAPVGMVAKAPMVMLAGPNERLDTVPALVKEAKARPGELQYAAGAQAFDLAMRLFNAKAGVRLTSVPYPGGAQAAIDVMAGRLPVMVDTIGAQLAQIKAGKLKAVAVLDSRRSAVLPDVPTVAEGGVAGYEAVGWVGVVAPRGTPEPIVAKLNGQLRQVMALPEVKDRLTQLGFEPSTGTPREFDGAIRQEYAKWGAVVKDAGLVAQK